MAAGGQVNNDDGAIAAAESGEEGATTTTPTDIRFSHVQLYVDDVRPVHEYKELEDGISAFHRDRFPPPVVPPSSSSSSSSSSSDGDGMRSPPCAGTTMPSASSSSSSSSSSRGRPFATHGRDVVAQLIAGLGFRVTGRYDPDIAAVVAAVVVVGDADTTAEAAKVETRTVLVTSVDPNGVRFLVTSLLAGGGGGLGGGGGGGENENNNRRCGGGVGGGSPSSTCGDERRHRQRRRYLHFDASNVERFHEAHRGRQGVAVLAFEVGRGSLDGIYKRYAAMHPNLIPEEYAMGARNYASEGRVFEAFAYYDGDKKLVADADLGTTLRFVEPCFDEGGKGAVGGIPGIVDVPASFPPSRSRPAYFDHWVSNVICRTGFLDTLEDVLGFTPKVDFNAGVVAAGEAQIESTVTGNDGGDGDGDDADAALRDRGQIYLPINNAVTDAGHVRGFLGEIGQGVQHVASRVGDIVDFVQRANDDREAFGEGFTFLSIPRSYYGVLTAEMLVRGVRGMEGSFLSPECATAVYGACVSGGLTREDSSLDLDATVGSITAVIDSRIPDEHREEYARKRGGIVETILRSRYVNLYNLLRDHLSEESYAAIVRNQILVDVQGEDLLFQIFTCNVLQRDAGDEAPFFEFIQRVCSERAGPDGRPRRVKPGCGGFGIRNFLTLFLSIEVTKAMLEAANARASGHAPGHDYARRKVDLFTEQLNESNPLLTEISDAMTREGAARERIKAYREGRRGGEEEEKEEKEKDDGIERWSLVAERELLAKSRANERLMQCNLKYQRLMKELRESQ